MFAMRRTALVIALVALSIIGVSTSTAFAASPSSADPALRQAVAQQLRNYPGGTQISPNEVSYHGGKVIVVFPDATGHVPTTANARPSVTPNATYYWHGCPYGDSASWYCFYADVNFGGRMLQFQDCSSGGTIQSLAQYGFANQTSSWVNTSGIKAASTSKWVDVYDGNNIFLWEEPPNSDSSWVGAGANDRAVWFATFC